MSVKSKRLSSAALKQLASLVRGKEQKDLVDAIGRFVVDLRREKASLQKKVGVLQGAIDSIRQENQRMFVDLEDSRCRKSEVDIELERAVRDAKNAKRSLSEYTEKVNGFLVKLVPAPVTEIEETSADWCKKQIEAAWGLLQVAYPERPQRVGYLRKVHCWNIEDLVASLSPSSMADLGLFVFCLAVLGIPVAFNSRHPITADKGHLRDLEKVDGAMAVRVYFRHLPGSDGQFA